MYRCASYENILQMFIKMFKYLTESVTDLFLLKCMEFKW